MFKVYFSGIFASVFSQFLDFPAQIVQKAIDKGAKEFFLLFLDFIPALIETINIALFSTIIGTLGAVFLSLGSTRGLDVPDWLITVFRRTMDVMRAFPELIIALFLIFLLGAGPVPAVIAVAFHTAGALGKFFSEVNENIDLKQVEGLKACGASWINRMLHGVLPQVMPNYTSYCLIRLEVNVRSSAILGFVGAGGIGATLNTAFDRYEYDTAAAILILIIGIVMLSEYISGYIRAGVQ